MGSLLLASAVKVEFYCFSGNAWLGHHRLDLVVSGLAILVLFSRGSCYLKIAIVIPFIIVGVVKLTWRLEFHHRSHILTVRNLVTDYRSYRIYVVVSVGPSVLV